MKCDKCLHIGDMKSCQNFKSNRYGKPVSGEEACKLIEIDVRKQ